jgi:RecA-family ATPase
MKPEAVQKEGQETTKSTKLWLRPDGRVSWERIDEARAPREVILKLPTAGQLLSEEIKERRFLLRPWFRQQESVLLYAATGVGKSLFALSTAISVAGGGQFLGWQVEECPKPEGWRVIYVDGEMHVGDIQDRLRGLLAGTDHGDKERVRRNLWILPRQGQGTEPWFPSITDPEGVAFYRELIQERGADLIIFDNFSTLAEVEDENNASALNSVTGTLLSLKQLGVATILVHHTGKDGESYRGSSKLAATFEVILKLEGALEKGHLPWRGDAQVRKASDPIRFATFLTTFEKMRSGRRAIPAYAWLEQEPQFGEEPRLRWKYENAENPRLNRILDGLEAGQWTTQKEIAAALEVDESTISRDIRVGEQFGLWTRASVKEQLRSSQEDGF